MALSTINSRSIAAGALRDSDLGTLDTLTVSGNATFDTSTLVVDAANNRVGMGTASPSDILHIRNSASTNVLIDAPTDNAILTLQCGSSDAGAEGAFINLIQNTTSKWQLGMNTDNSFRLYNYNTSSEALHVNSSGNVGIGCAPDSALEIRTATNSSSDTTYLKLSNLGENVGHIDFENGNGNLARITGTKLGAGASANDGILTFSTAFDAVLSERMRIDASGNVGIGTSSATQRLSVKGTNSTAGQTGADVTMDVYDDSTGGIDVGGAIGFRGNDGINSNVMFGEVSGRKENATSGNYASYMGFKTRANSGSLTERLRIDSSGNVSIGGASIPASSGAAGRYFDIYNVGTDATSFAIHRLITSNVTGTGTTSADIYRRKNGEFTISNNETDAAAYTRFIVGTLERMRIDSAGITSVTAFKPNKYEPVYGPTTVTGGFVNGASVNTWHTITNININAYLGTYLAGQRGLIIELFWTSGNTSLGYNHTVRIVIPANSSNTFSGYSSGNFSSYQIAGNHYDELPSTAIHHTSLTATHNIRFRLRNPTGVDYDPLRLQINASSAPDANGAKITIWRA